ncbi:MAG: hypothetical protein AUI12_08150 [Acidobacteria bacterium 13_2_20CM_2_57_6]|nr:MAG: hypothetical protein AUI12_08150 [Acidobacteria bacterium 13_2_20CM_2_57_6]
MNPAFPFYAYHARAKIWQVKPRSRNCNRRRIAGVQTEKPHAGLAIVSHIGSDVQFGKCRKPRKRRRPA